MPTILGANSDTGAYEIDNSLRFNNNDTYLNRTPSSEGNRKTWTISTWVKRGAIFDSSGVNADADQVILGASASNLIYAHFYFTHDLLRFYDIASGTYVFHFKTNAEFRDPAAWYHIVVSCDTTQSTESDRFKIYVNGEQITSWNASVYPSQNADTLIHSTNIHTIGRYADQSNGFYDGYMTEYHLVDGAAKAHTDFGEFDDNGVWIPKKYTGTYGTNGFFMEFQQTGTSQNSSGMGADTSGQDNHYAPNNLAATDVTEDTCTNNFATLNPLAFGDNEGTLSEGNLKHTRNGGDSDVVSTIGISSGKFYAEFKVESDISGRPGIAVYNDYDNGATNYGSVNGSVLFVQDGRILVNNSSIGDFGSISQNDIIQVAVDNDNGAIYIGQNGTYLNSGNHTSGSSRTGSVSNFTAGSVTCFIGARANNNSVASANFGNPAFAISSGNNDGKYGNFEYAPPSGYYALCTKRLAEFG